MKAPFANLFSVLTALAVFFAVPSSALGQTADAENAPSAVTVGNGMTMGAVAAVVDNQVITTFDVVQRVKLMMLSSGNRVTPSMIPQMEAQALRDLVEEKLKLMEAEKFDVVPDAREIEAEIAGMAAQGGLSPAEFEKTLAADGISISTVRSQITASMAWPRIVRGRFGSRVRVSDEEVESTLTRMREEAGAEQFLVSEICLPVPSPEQAQTYYEGGLQLIEQMRRGVPFAVVAQQFSACTSAAAGGDIGWVRAGQLPADLDRAIKELPRGAVTNPIPSEGAFMILAVRDKREARQQGEKSYSLAYAGAPLTLGRAAARQSLEKLASANACGGGRRQDLGPDVGVARIENAKLSDLDERFRDVIDGLDRGDLSPIIEADEALHIAYVCELDEGLGIPSRRSIEDSLFSRRLSQISQQYLRDVERKVMVDVRSPRQPAEALSQDPGAGL
ncbi:MAG: peptidylprolyl isomerase [Pseudomonadota bacterium]